MKKSLLALAVLSAFAGAASAQSSVTLSGGVDLGVVRQNGAWNMQTAGSGRSAFTLSGVEDLGGGMRAFFAMNHRFNPNNGTTNETFASRYWRQGWVGLRGGFGEVRLGRFLPPLQTLNGEFDPFITDTVGSTHTGGINAGSAGSARYNNAIDYVTPSLGGLTVRAMIAAADQNASAALANGTERPIGFGINYAAGPLRVALAYDRNALDFKTTGVYGSFNAGFATLMAQWENGDVSATADVTRWSVGARVPMGAATLKAGYTNWSDENTKKIGVGLDYALSKRTNLYTDLGKLGGSGQTATAKKARFDVGVFHRF